MRLSRTGYCETEKNFETLSPPECIIRKDFFLSLLHAGCYFRVMLQGTVAKYRLAGAPRMAAGMLASLALAEAAAHPDSRHRVRGAVAVAFRLIFLSLVTSFSRARGGRR